MSVAEFVRRRAPGAQALFLLLGLALLWFVVRRVAWIDLRHVLADLRPLRLIPLLVMNGLILLAFNARWWLFLRAQGYTPPFLALLRYRLAAFGVSYFTPGPHTGGEPLQILLVQRNHHVPGDVALASVALDKIFDLTFNFSFLLISLTMALRSTLLADRLGPESILYILWWPLLLIALLIAWRCGAHPFTQLLRWSAFKFRTLLWIEKRPISQRIGQLGRKLYAGIQRSEARMVTLCRERGRWLLIAGLISAASWVLLIIEFWMATNVLALDLTLTEAVLVLAATRVAILLPLPAGMGALEASLVLALESLGLTGSAGVALAVLIRLRDVGLGLLGLWLAGQDWRNE